MYLRDEVETINMKDWLNKKRLLAIGGVLVVVVGMLVGVFLIANQGSFSLVSKAGPTATPRQVEISNVDSESFTVSWISDTQVSGFVKYGESPSDLKKTISDDRDQLSGSVGLYTTHYITVRGLVANTDYYFVIGSGSETYKDGNEAVYKIKTAPVAGAPESDMISGKVIMADGQPVPGAVVYVEIEGGVLRSAQTKNSGVWTLPLSLTRMEDLSSYVTYDRETTQLNIFVQAAELGTATAVVTTGNDSPVPDIVLGESLEVIEDVGKGATSSGELQQSRLEIVDGALVQRQLTVAAGTLVTVINKDEENHSVTAVGREFDTGVIGGGSEGSFSAPDEAGTYAFYDSVNPDLEGMKGEILVIAQMVEETQEATEAAELGSGFGDIGGSYPEIDEAYEATLSVKLVTEIDPGENVATSTPEIKVAGPVGQKIKITVHSDPQTEEVTIGEDGEINWTPPEGLEPGEHTLEIEYQDENGVWQKIVRSFVVLADEPTTGQGGLPAFSATPSATLTPTMSLTPTPTATGSATDSGRATMPSTESGVPESGVLTLTLAIFMMGVGLFVGGIVWQYRLIKRYSS